MPILLVSSPSVSKHAVRLISVPPFSPVSPRLCFSDEFQTFAITHPEYAKLFTTYLELQRFQAIQEASPGDLELTGQTSSDNKEEDSISDKKDDWHRGEDPWNVIHWNGTFWGFICHPPATLSQVIRHCWAILWVMCLPFYNVFLILLSILVPYRYFYPTTSTSHCAENLCSFCCNRVQIQ